MSKIVSVLRKNLENIYIAFGIIIIYGAIIAALTNPFVFSLLKENILLIVSGLMVLVVAVYVTSTIGSRTERRMKLAEYEKIRLGRTHPMFYHHIIKSVTIKAANGDARIEMLMNCENIRGKCLSQIVHNIFHDGGLLSLKGSINGRDAGTKLSIERFQRMRVDNDKPLKTPFEAVFVYHMEEEKIEHGQIFSYGYEMEFEKLYREMLERGKESSAIRIKNPTRLVTLTVDAPEGFRFVEDGVYPKVIDMHEVEDCLEVERCTKVCPPRITNQRTRILWELDHPKIASKYELYFQVEEHTTKADST